MNSSPLTFKLKSSTSTKYSLLDRAGFVSSVKSIDYPIFIVDENVANAQAELIKSLCDSSPTFITSISEEKKTIEKVLEIIDFLIERQATRQHTLIAIGGGVLLDTVGYAASIYKRGMRTVFIPTSLVAMIDASIGGKTGINYRDIKNLAGTFYPAKEILVLPDFLLTLPPLEWKNGLAELIKISFVEPNILYDTLNRYFEQLNSDNKVDAIQLLVDKEIILLSAELKGKLCEADLLDLQERRKLNLGHTFAHVIESATNYLIPHGIAVSIGIRAAAQLSVELKLCKPEVVDKVSALLNLYGFPERLNISQLSLILSKGKELFAMDKKGSAKGLRLILFKQLQEVEVIEGVDATQAINALASL
ncbi:MAG: 3-dehydroquinate synthase family protein [Candidatus Cloacimonadia bacterium]